MIDVNGLLVISLFHLAQRHLLMFPLMDEDLDLLTELNELNPSGKWFVHFVISIKFLRFGISVPFVHWHCQPWHPSCAKRSSCVCTRFIHELFSQMFRRDFCSVLTDTNNIFKLTSVSHIQFCINNNNRMLFSKMWLIVINQTLTWLMKKRIDWHQYFQHKVYRSVLIESSTTD